MKILKWCILYIILGALLAFLYYQTLLFFVILGTSGIVYLIWLYCFLFGGGHEDE